MSKDDLIVTRNGVPFADQMEGIRQFKEAAFKAAEKARTPQDVEGFIAEQSYYDPEHPKSSSHDYILVDDLRAWMTGHVRVPVELLRKRFESPSTIDQCEAEADFLALLNASKGE